MQSKPFHLVNFLTPPSTEISHFLAADNQLIICNGVDPSGKKGVLTKDLGYSKVGTTLQSNEKVTSLHNFRQSSTVQKILATINDGTGAKLTLQYNNAGTWTAINVGSTYDGYEDSLVEFEDFIGYCFIVGYDSNDNVFLPVGSLINTTFSTVTNVTNMPQAKTIKRYRDRLYVGNVPSYPYRVVYSSVPVAGAITWTPATDFFDVDYSEQIIGMESNWDKLNVFTEFSFYQYDQSSKAKIADVGCINNRTIQTYGPYLIWADKYSVWASTGGRPTAVSSDIRQLIVNSDPTKWQSAVIDDEYHLYLGATSADGLDYTNCLATMNLQDASWRWRELYNNATALTRHTSSGDDLLYIGTTSGEVMVKSKITDASPVYTDNGKAIKAHFRTKAFDFGDPTIDKTINKIIAYAENGSGLMLRFRVFNSNMEINMPWTDIGQLYQVISDFQKRITGRFIQFEGKSYDKNKSFNFYGLSANLGADSKL